MITWLYVAVDSFVKPLAQSMLKKYTLCECGLSSVRLLSYITCIVLYAQFFLLLNGNRRQSHDKNMIGRLPHLMKICLKMLAEITLITGRPTYLIIEWY